MTTPSDNNAALLRAQQLMQQLRVSYLEELPERVEELEQRVLALPASDDFVQQFEELYRKTHSLKGSAGTYGLQIISTICHQLEESLVCVVNDSSKVDEDFLDRCIACFDLMRLAIKQAVQGESRFPEIEQALAGMRAVVADQQLTVLLVEHSRLNSTLYLAMLKDLPIRFSVVASGLEALELLLHNSFDLLITGYENPSLNGIALIAAVRLNKGINQDMHAILLTSASKLAIPEAVKPLTVLSRNEQISVTLLHEVEAYLAGKKR